MAFWKFNMGRMNAFENQARADAIASNSFACSSGDAIRITATGFATTAWVWERIDGIALNNTTYSSNNQTVSKQRVDMIPSFEKTATWQIPVAGWSITEANIADFFDLDVNQNVDFTTASTTVWVCRLVKVLSATLGEFTLTGQGT